jgi:hypothetical protein
MRYRYFDTQEQATRFRRRLCRWTSCTGFVDTYRSGCHVVRYWPL